ncbi:MAG: WcaF family extracellular polysaccharide biosynthesis acetyltransferase [Flavobacteriales bacterium]|nr:WcaF family extracellular polysaccharide biosynthesis acetyltransferase [Flavobacteriales bacterium]
MQGKTDLSQFNNDWYQPGSAIKRALWYIVNVLFFINPLMPISGLKVALLRLFGAKVGAGVVIKPVVNIKYPWKLTIGDHTWIGEKVWIDNLGVVKIGANACLSQGSMLLCGNHNYKKAAFDLMVGDITIEDGAWIGAHSVVCPGVTCGSHSILAVNSVATHDLEAYKIYQGNPAQFVRNREINT